MRKLLILAVLGAIPLAGCKKDEAAPGAGKEATGSGTTAAVAATYEVGCASCIYKMPGVAGCQAAVKVGEKPMLLSGGNVDIMAIGGCTAAKQATVEGKVEGDKFVASKVELKK